MTGDARCQPSTAGLFEFREFRENAFRDMEVQICGETQTVQFSTSDHGGDHPTSPAVAIDWADAVDLANWILSCTVAQAAPEPVRCIETVTGIFSEPGEPIWRLEIGGYCADFVTETAANNFRKAIIALSHGGISDSAYTAPPSLPDVLESCKIEHKEFDKWAASKGYSMEEHPLHYLFLEPRTYAARQGWKAALEYVARTVAPPSTNGGSAAK